MCIMPGVCGVTASDVHRCASLCVDSVHNVCRRWCLPLCTHICSGPSHLFLSLPWADSQAVPKEEELLHVHLLQGGRPLRHAVSPL